MSKHCSLIRYTIEKMLKEGLLAKNDVWQECGKGIPYSRIVGICAHCGFNTENLHKTAQHAKKAVPVMKQLGLLPEKKDSK